MVVSNSGPVIWLSQIGQFNLLQHLFGRLLIAPEVHAETVDRAAGHRNATEVSRACAAGWMEVVAPADRALVATLSARLHSGEAETLVIAREQGAEAVLVDDLQARNFAIAMGLDVIGTAGILLLAHHKGLSVDVKAALGTMRSRGFRLSDKVYQDILRRVSEATEESHRP